MQVFRNKGTWSRPKSQPSLKLAILLLLAGDVSLNPGPSTCSTDRVGLATLNARSMKNKAASLADMVSSKKIDHSRYHRDMVKTV